MTSFLEDISEVCIYLQKDGETSERVNEVALYQPLAKKSVFGEKHKALQNRRHSFTRELPFNRRLFLKIQTFFLQKIPILVKDERKNIEAKFKTVLAILLSQEALFDFLLTGTYERENFFKTISETAARLGYTDFSLPPEDLSSSQMGRYLTTLSWQSNSLLDNLEELNLQMATLERSERDEILFNILNHIKRMPLTSVIEVASGEAQTRKIVVTTKYGKYKIKNIDPFTGKIDYIGIENETKVSIPTQKEENRGGTINQHAVYDTTNVPLFIGSVSGYLKSKFHVLEQILFLLDVKKEVSIEENTPHTEEKTLLFTSLFSWNEYDKIQNEHNAILSLDGKVLNLDNHRKIRLILLHQNIPFNAFNKFPTPSEIHASLNDLNDSGLIHLSNLCLKALEIDFPPLTKLIKEQKQELDYLKKQQFLLNEIDTFRSFQKKLVNTLEDFLATTTLELSERVMAISLKALLLKKMPNGKPWHEIEHLIYLSLLAKNLGIIHNKNCEHATDRSAGAISIDKAQNAFTNMLGKPFLPGLSTTQENALFRVFYSMYLVFEEPELNAGLCTGFVGEKFYDNFIQKNPETTYYLIPWLHKHPEMYLGLSNHRF